MTPLLTLPRGLQSEQLLESLLAQTVPPFVFAGPARTLAALDAGRAIEGTLQDPEALLARLEQALRAPRFGAAPRVCGAVPFAAGAPVCLFQPHWVLESGPWLAPTDGGSDRAAVWGKPASARRPALGARDEGAFLQAVERTLQRISAGEFRKVVLARARDVVLPRPVSIPRLLRQLRNGNPNGYTFALALPELDPRPSAPSNRVLLGASPELLLARRGAHIESTPLAGSVPRSEDREEDQRRARRLLCSEKDLREHAIVVDHVVESLRPFAQELNFASRPSVVGTGTMWHLATHVSGTLKDMDVSSLRLALALHPTPAVCGSPTAAAAAWIAQAEGFDRGYFTGALGHMDAVGDGEWIVTIRCAEVSQNSARVFAGAGIVEGSVPSLELAETEGKMRTLLSLLEDGGAE